MRRVGFNFLAVIGVFAASCTGTEVEPEAQLPENLTVDITLASNVRGKVDVKANAQKVNYYSVLFGSGTTGVLVESSTGNASHTFDKPGKYPIRVRAHSTATAFIEKIDSVLIDEAGLQDGYNTPISYTGYNLVWADEFNGSELDMGSWSYNVGRGNGGWGNNESQYYTEGTNNCVVKDGRLIITAKRENVANAEYSSARIVTQGKKEFQYGRIDMRAKLPKGQGIWPALWMLGSNITSAGWPACGEIDIMELVGHIPNTVYGTAHWGSSFPSTYRTGQISLPAGEFDDQYHVFTIIWEQNQIKWYMDDKAFHTITPSNTGSIYPFNNKFFFIFNVAVGGNWPGYPDGTTVFPQTMEVDFVRVFQKN